MIIITKQLKERASTGLSNQNIRTKKDNKLLTVYDWFTKTKNPEQVFVKNRPLIDKYENEYGDITEENVANILVAFDEKNTPELIPMNEVIGFIHDEWSN